MNGVPNKKFMQILEPVVYGKLKKEAKERGITIQELIRAVVIPDWTLQRSRNPWTIAGLREIRKREARRKGNGKRWSAS